ncbi:MAG: hypothetical protein V5A38_05055 [Halolamina sp.]|uniref:DUF7547 family protein n=1 Tax=Halolamina sp. TaxID=1940283 RepID=UPI002FC27A94
MSDRRDTDPELETMLSELETTLTELRGTLTDGERAPASRSGHDRRRDAGRRDRPIAPRPPGMRELLRFTEQQTIPTLIAILEANIRLLRLAGAALRAVDPERSAVETGEESAVSRALDAGGRLSTDRLSSGLGELQEALSGTEPTDPEARQLLEEAERLSEVVRERVPESDGRRRSVGGVTDAGATERETSESAGPVHIDVEESTASDDEGAKRDAETDSGVDVDAELDSIREEVRGEPTEKDAEAAPDSDHGGAESETDEAGGDESAAEESGDDESADSD